MELQNRHTGKVINAGDTVTHENGVAYTFKFITEVPKQIQGDGSGMTEVIKIRCVEPTGRIREDQQTYTFYPWEVGCIVKS